MRSKNCFLCFTLWITELSLRGFMIRFNEVVESKNFRKLDMYLLYEILSRKHSALKMTQFGYLRVIFSKQKISKSSEKPTGEIKLAWAAFSKVVMGKNIEIIGETSTRHFWDAFHTQTHHKSSHRDKYRAEMKFSPRTIHYFSPSVSQNVRAEVFNILSMLFSYEYCFLCVILWISISLHSC